MNFWEAKRRILRQLPGRDQLPAVSADTRDRFRHNLRPVVQRICELAYPAFSPVTRDMLVNAVLDEMMVRVAAE
jgi:hypothetical protein